MACNLTCEIGNIRKVLGGLEGLDGIGSTEFCNVRDYPHGAEKEMQAGKVTACISKRPKKGINKRI
jgi:hypothetical protein